MGKFNFSQNIFILSIYILSTFSTDLIYEFKKAKEPTTRTIYVRLGSQIHFSCFIMTENDRNYGRLVALLNNANWKGPRGNILMPGLIESNRIHIDELKTLRIFKAILKDTGEYKCVILKSGSKTVEHTVDLLVYTVPEVALETPFVFKVLGNCKHNMHKMAPMAEHVYNHLCGTHDDPNREYMKTCQFNLSMVCQPYKTYESIMMEENDHLKKHLEHNISTVVNKTHSKMFFMKFKDDKEINETRILSKNTTVGGESSDSEEDDDSPDYDDYKQEESEESEETAAGGRKRSVDATEDKSPYLYDQSTVKDDNYPTFEPLPSPSTLNPMDYPELTVSSTLGTTTRGFETILDPKEKELQKMNEVFSEENKRDLVVMYVLKIPDPLFDPPDCENDCLLRLKIYEISWHSDTIVELLEFIQLLPSLPSGVALMPETVFKGRLVLYCKPGFFISGNYCLPCVPGSHNDLYYYSTCKACPLNTFQEEYGKKTCDSCPEDMKTKVQVGSYRSSDCYYVGKEQTYPQIVFSIIIRTTVSFFTCCACIYALIACVNYVRGRKDSNAELTGKMEQMERHLEEAAAAAEDEEMVGAKLNEATNEIKAGTSNNNNNINASNIKNTRRSNKINTRYNMNTSSSSSSDDECVELPEHQPLMGRKDRLHTSKKTNNAFSMDEEGMKRYHD